MRVGFSGTRYGMSPAQKAVVAVFLALEIDEFHHGDCIGADAEAHDIAEELGWLIFIHPPSNASMRAWKQSKRILPARDYMPRNRDIVRCSDLIIAAPNSKEIRRSGTWATVRFARELGRQIKICWPDGKVDIENASR